MSHEHNSTEPLNGYYSDDPGNTITNNPLVGRTWLGKATRGVAVGAIVFTGVVGSKLFDKINSLEDDYRKDLFIFKDQTATAEALGLNPSVTETPKPTDTLIPPSPTLTETPILPPTLFVSSLTPTTIPVMSVPEIFYSE